MKVIRIICPGCGRENQLRQDTKNLKEYQEEIISKPCEECGDTPEVKLLEAIFGGKEDGKENNCRV